MEGVSNYTFVPLASKNYVGINNKTTQSLFSKWGIRGNFVIQHFSFNEPFQQYQKYLLVDAFFKDNIIGKELITMQGNHWAKQGITSSVVEMLLDEECPEYNLYTKDEREEFIFRIFQMLVLGGILCQHEDKLDPYLDATKTIYKDLIRVEKQNDSDLSVSTLVLEVVVKDSKNQAYFPCKPSHIQNIGFLLVYNKTREITTFLHQYGEYCLSGEV
ncbi:cilia- and flagella-associated protein 300 isoform X3 [Lasioglossum baleicum]|uniref:cilia- and flagella-associated protein 300 isoform X3 n=1 Tax=Lasioglossum baleicum TaxID=434251 RepID=UPI003FCE0827